MTLKDKSVLEISAVVIAHIHPCLNTRESMSVSSWLPYTCDSVPKARLVVTSSLWHYFWVIQNSKNYQTFMLHLTVFSRWSAFTCNMSSLIEVVFLDASLPLLPPSFKVHNSSLATHWRNCDHCIPKIQWLLYYPSSVLVMSVLIWHCFIKTQFREAEW